MIGGWSMPEVCAMLSRRCRMAMHERFSPKSSMTMRSNISASRKSGSKSSRERRTGAMCSSARAAAAMGSVWGVSTMSRTWDICLAEALGALE